MENKFNVDDKVIYEGVDAPVIGLIKGQEYTVKGISAFGAISLQEIVSDYDLHFHVDQFSLVTNQVALMQEVEKAVQPTTSEVVFGSDSQSAKDEDFALPSTETDFESSALNILADLSVELNEGIEKVIKRAPKFKNKPGSAVVYYTSGATFHITKLASLEVYEDIVAVTRIYSKDGLHFSQSVGIPIEMFEKVVVVADESLREEGVIDTEFTVTYDTERKALVYPMTTSVQQISF